jgi:hypothetical protein
MLERSDDYITKIGESGYEDLIEKMTIMLNPGLIFSVIY